MSSVTPSTLGQKLHTWGKRHPLLRDAILWSLPALVVGAAFRLLMLHYMPFAYWGSDSRSYFDFVHKLFAYHSWSLNEKRRVLYPIWIAFITFLPGTPLRWVAWIQHLFGLLTVLPLAYVLRRTLVFWKWWLIPVTLLYVSFPMLLWYEHELLAETIFFSLILWTFGGWVAWVSQAEARRSRQLWWWFLIPFALFIMTKPAGRFYWPGLVCGFVLVAAWRRLRWPQYASILLLMVITLSLGAKKYAAWLLYVNTLPLTQLQTPLHADYKAQIRDKVEHFRGDIEHYYGNDDEPFAFLEHPALLHQPLWAALDDDEKLRAKIYMDLALEGIKAKPRTFLYLGLGRSFASANLSDFKLERFKPYYQTNRLKDDYDNTQQRMQAGQSPSLPLALGYSVMGPLPPFAEVAQRLSPAPDSLAAQWIPAWAEAWGTKADLTIMPKRSTLSQMRLTWLGWYLAASALVSLALRRYRATMGVWAIASFGYVYGVFLFAQMNPRYFGPAWPIFLPLLAVLPDALCVGLARLRAKRLASV